MIGGDVEIVEIVDHVMIAEAPKDMGKEVVVAIPNQLVIETTVDLEKTEEKGAPHFLKR